LKPEKNKEKHENEREKDIITRRDITSSAGAFPSRVVNSNHSMFDVRESFCGGFQKRESESEGKRDENKMMGLSMCFL
jgi:hypothetical protein